MIMSDCIMDARRLLSELVPDEFRDADFISWSNMAEREIVTFVPSSNTNIVDFTCAANVALQALPVGTIRLVDDIRNSGADGTVQGRSVTKATRQELAAWDRNWLQSTAGTEVKSYAWEEDQPLVFFIWPRLSSGLHLALRLAQEPSAKKDTSQALTLQDIFRNPVVYFMIGCALEKLKKYDEAATWFEKFTATLGVKASADKINRHRIRE